jgi:hypothetical protein
MADDPNTSRSLNSVARSDPDVDLLQRSIDHVEHLLNRLEYGGGQGQDDNLAHRNGTTHDVGTKSEVTEADGPERATQISVEGTKPASDAVPPAVQADVLRIKLRAYAEANRIRASAAEVHAKAVTDSERLLIEAERLCEQLRTNAISETAARAEKLRTYAQSEVEAIKRDFRRWVGSAVVEVAAEADRAPLRAHDAFTALVERFTDVLTRLQEFAIAIGPHGALATALTERQRLTSASDDPVAMTPFEPSTRDDLATEAVTNDQYPSGSNLSKTGSEAPPIHVPASGR